MPNFRKYDVFINHRGKDVKKTAASLIYHYLRNRNLNVFLDKEAIQRGNYFPLVIREAIRTSSVHIVIFSRRFAESKWCLEELRLMVESGAPIIPIFWRVRPSQLRKEGGLYSKFLQKHLRSGSVDAQTVNRWRTALRQVSYTYGFEFQGDYGMLLENISSCVTEQIQAKRGFQEKRVQFTIFRGMKCRYRSSFVSMIAVNLTNRLVPLHLLWR